MVDVRAPVAPSGATPTVPPREVGELPLPESPLGAAGIDRGASDAMLLPAGTRVLHIGPHKTGTTTVQYAFHAARAELEAQGIFYPGPNSQPMFAVYAVTGRAPEYMQRPPIGRWLKLVRAIDARPAARTVISSEGLCDADDEAVRRIVRDLGPDRIHVLVTLRPLSDLLASQWQQSTQDGRTDTYESWLRRIFDDPGSTGARWFWHRHHHDRLVERWARVVGRDRLTVIVVDERDHERTLRVIERLVGLASGTLQARGGRTNRSLTSPEIELVRALNQRFREAGLDRALQTKFVRDGIAQLLRSRTPAKDEPRIRTPAWARERALAVSQEIVDGIAASGVRVIGDLGRLARKPRGRSPGASRVPEESFAASAEIAAAGPLGVLLMSGLAREGGSAPFRPDDDLAHVSTIQLRRVLSGRVRQVAASRLPTIAAGARKVRRRLRAIRRTGRPGSNGSGP